MCVYVSLSVSFCLSISVVPEDLRLQLERSRLQEEELQRQQQKLRDEVLPLYRMCSLDRMCSLYIDFCVDSIEMMYWLSVPSALYSPI
jgi:hypothetical protein